MKKVSEITFTAFLAKFIMNRFNYYHNFKVVYISMDVILVFKFSLYKSNTHLTLSSLHKFAFNFFFTAKVTSKRVRIT